MRTRKLKRRRLKMMDRETDTTPEEITVTTIEMKDFAEVKEFVETMTDMTLVSIDLRLVLSND